jgi:hypothetical protein
MFNQIVESRAAQQISHTIDDKEFAGSVDMIYITTRARAGRRFPAVG